MEWTTTDDARRFLDSAGPFLLADAASNTVLLTAAETVAAGGPAAYGDEPPLFGWWASASGAVSGAFVHTPPYPAQLSALPGGAIGPLAELLRACERRLAGVGAAGRLAAAFADAWCARRDEIAELDMALRLYSLVALRPPRCAPPGHADVATIADRALVRDWIEVFALETGARMAGSRTLDQRLAAGSLTIWRDGRGTPVALAGWSREVAGTRRIGPVYTVAQHRRHGYGAAVTAIACRRALDGGTRQLLLYADAANPTSNTLYRRLGFQLVEDRIALRFTPRPSRSAAQSA